MQLIVIKKEYAKYMHFVLTEAKSCNLPTLAYDIDFGPREIIDNDIAAGNLYVIEEADKEQQTEGTDNKNSRVHGVFFFKMGEDATYNVIEDGSWLSGDTYGTIHRVAGDGQVHGVLTMAVQFCEQKIKHLRIDTHNDNKIMQHVIEKNGFKRCGIIHVKDGSERIAYEKLG